MNTKKIIAILILCFSLSIAAHAKSKPATHQLTADEIVAKMKLQLRLTDQQIDGVKVIIENYLAQEEQLKLEEKKQLSHVLTGEQLYTWNFIEHEHQMDKKQKRSLF